MAAVSCLTDTPLRRGHLGSLTSFGLAREAALSRSMLVCED
jgi:hypothetical protein